MTALSLFDLSFGFLDLLFLRKLPIASTDNRTIYADRPTIVTLPKNRKIDSDQVKQMNRLKSVWNLVEPDVLK